jgi:hypothetical protein
MRRRCRSTSSGKEWFHLAADRGGSCDDALCLGINNTVSGFFCGGGFGVGWSEAPACAVVEVEEDSSMPRWRMIASRLGYFLASRGSTGSMYLCFLGAGSRGGLVRGAGLGTMILVTVIIPDLGTGEGVVEEANIGGVEEGVDVAVVDALDELELLDELVGEGENVAGSI